MARFLALDWDHNQLHVVAASTGATGLKLHKAVLFPEDKSPNPADAEALGRRLKAHLKEAGIAPAPVLACVGRERTILKEVRYPKVPANEEPAVVRFQAVKELSEQPDDVVLDYTNVGEATPGGEQRALVLVVRREFLAAYQTLCQAAGLKLHALTPRPFGVVASLRYAHPGAVAPDEAAAVLALGDRWAELSVVRGDTLLFARSLSPGTNLPGEVRRSLALYNGQWPRHPARSLSVADSGEHAALAGRLRATLEIPVESYDPLAGLPTEGSPASRGSFAGAAGLLHARARKAALAVNFARPKEPRKARDPNRARAYAAAAVAALAVLGVVGYGYAVVAKKDHEIDALVAEKEALDRALLDVEEDSKRIKALDEWSQGQVVWLDELYDLTDRFGDTNTLRLVQLTGEPLSVAARGKNGGPKHAARLALKGISTNNYQAVDALVGELVADGHYRVEPKQLKRNTGVDRVRFPQEFTTRIEVAPRAPAAYVRHMQPPDDPGGRDRDRRRGRGGDAADAEFGGFGGQP